MTFAAKKDLVEWLNQNDYEQLSNGSWYPTGTYYLAHGEYSQPEFLVRRYKDGWSLHGNWFFYPGTFGAKKDGRVDEDFYWR